MATSFNSSWNSSDSSSVPGIFPTPQSDFSLQLAQFLEQLGQQQMQWAQQEYARAGRVTDAQIENFVKLAQSGADMAGQALDRYNNMYAPLEDQYAREAQSWASDARMSREMGSAMSRTAQAHNKAKINAENELESFGIDPSSGRYQDLVRASNTEAATAMAAAGEAARVATEQQADQRKMNAINFGQKLPTQALQALNSAYQGVGGAAKTALDLANTGTNMMALPAKFLEPAMRPLQPLQGNTSTSTGRGGSSGGSTSPSGGGGGGSRTSDPFNSDRFGRGSSAPPMAPSRTGAPGGQNTAGQQPGGAVTIKNPYYQGAGNEPTAPGTSPWDEAGFNDAWMQDGINGSNMYGDPTFDSQGSWDTGGFEDAYAPDYNEWGYDPSTYDTEATGYNDFGDNYYGNNQGSWDTSGYDDSTWGDTGDTGNGWDDSGGGAWDSGWDDSGGGAWDSGWDDSGGASGWDASSSYGDFSSADDWGDFAKGGPVQRPMGRPARKPMNRPLPRGNMGRPDQPSGGGFVPPSMSPSRGQRTDDIPAVIPQTGGQARINAGEFVLPEDVVKWKGQEFFQKMIQQARKARMGAPAKPTMRKPGGFNG